MYSAKINNNAGFFPKILKRTLTVLISAMVLNSYGATQELSENVRSKVNVLVKLEQQVHFLTELLLNRINVGKGSPANSLINNIFGEFGRIWDTSGSIEKLWSSTTFWGWETYEETDGGIGALGNRLQRFNSVLEQQQLSERKEVMELHTRIVDGVSKILSTLRNENNILWRYIIQDSYRKKNLKIFEEHKGEFQSFRSRYFEDNL